MTDVKFCTATPKLEVAIKITYKDNTFKKIVIKEGQLLNNIVYLDGGEEKTVSGVLNVINFSSKAVNTGRDGCVHDDESVLTKYVTVNSLLVDCSKEYDCNILNIPIKLIRNIGRIEDHISDTDDNDPNIITTVYTEIDLRNAFESSKQNIVIEDEVAGEGQADSAADYGNITSTYLVENIGNGITISGSGKLVMNNNTKMGLIAATWDGATKTYNDGTGVLTINDVTMEGANDTCVLYIQGGSNADDKKGGSAALNNVTINATNGAGLYTEYGTEVVLNNCNINQIAGTPSAEWFNSAIDIAYGTNLVINGGNYSSETGYAARVLSSGGNITINDGNFKGILKADAGKITVNGGIFSVDPTEFLGEGHTVKVNEDGTYIIE